MNDGKYSKFLAVGEQRVIDYLGKGEEEGYRLIPQTFEKVNVNADGTVVYSFLMQRERKLSFDPQVFNYNN